MTRNDTKNMGKIPKNIHRNRNSKKTLNGNRPRNRNRLRAQRKFAVGGYAPPQVSVPPQVTPNAAHKASSTPGRITKTTCTATALLTRLSLHKTHVHLNDLPVSILENDDTPIHRESNKTNKTKETKDSSQKSVRPGRKSARTKQQDKNRSSSFSDSGEDTPLSRLQNPQVTSDTFNLKRNKKSALNQKTKKKHVSSTDYNIHDVMIVVERQDLTRHVKNIPTSAGPSKQIKRISNKTRDPNMKTSQTVKSKTSALLKSRTRSRPPASIPKRRSTISTRSSSNNLRSHSIDSDDSESRSSSSSSERQQRKNACAQPLKSKSIGKRRQTACLSPQRKLNLTQNDTNDSDSQASNDESVRHVPLSKLRQSVKRTAHNNASVDSESDSEKEPLSSPLPKSRRGSVYDRVRSNYPQFRRDNDKETTTRLQNDKKDVNGYVKAKVPSNCSDTGTLAGTSAQDGTSSEPPEQNLATLQTNLRELPNGTNERESPSLTEGLEQNFARLQNEIADNASPFTNSQVLSSRTSEPGSDLIDRCSPVLTDNMENVHSENIQEIIDKLESNDNIDFDDDDTTEFLEDTMQKNNRDIEDHELTFESILNKHTEITPESTNEPNSSLPDTQDSINKNEFKIKDPTQNTVCDNMTENAPSLQLNSQAHPQTHNNKRPLSALYDDEDDSTQSSAALQTLIDRAKATKKQAQTAVKTKPPTKCNEDITISRNSSPSNGTKTNNLPASATKKKTLAVSVNKLNLSSLHKSSGVVTDKPNNSQAAKKKTLTVQVDKLNLATLKNSNVAQSSEEVNNRKGLPSKKEKLTQLSVQTKKKNSTLSLLTKKDRAKPLEGKQRLVIPSEKTKVLATNKKKAVLTYKKYDPTTSKNNHSALLTDKTITDKELPESSTKTLPGLSSKNLPDSSTIDLPGPSSDNNLPELSPDKSLGLSQASNLIKTPKLSTCNEKSPEVAYDYNMIWLQQNYQRHKHASPKEPKNISKAPVYRPTQDEFQDPILYIKSIEAEASKFGMCKIIPPEGFHVPCRLDENCMFGTINQHLGRLYHRWGPNSKEMASIQTYLTGLTPRDKEHFTKAPMFDGVEVDLVKLYTLVLKQGGIEGYLAHSEKWGRIAAQMNFVSPRGRPDPKKLEKLYCKHVLPYESLTDDERQAARDKANKIWNIRVKNQILRASWPLHYQQAMLGEEGAVPEYEEAFPEPDLADIYNICKPIYDKIEECTGKGRPLNLTTFRRISSQIQGMRFPNGLPDTVTEIEEKYWEILNSGNEHVCVLSAFIDTSVDSLGHESNPHSPGGSHPWNLKRIGENPNNILSSLGKALSVTVPTLCLNQLYSTNCWHMDPHKLAWLDYMHEGATKIWYSVPASGAPLFRRAVQDLTEAAVQDKGIWLASDTTMIPPSDLLDCSVPVQRIEQNPNEFVVVFPGAYACSISTGLSVAESIYFETEDWLKMAVYVFDDMHKDCEPSMFSCVLLLMKMAQSSTLGNESLVRVYTILSELIEEEYRSRREANTLKCRVVIDKFGREDGAIGPVSWPNQEECCLCRLPLVLSKISKYDEPRKQMCLKHGMKYMRLARTRADAEVPLVTLHYTTQELTKIVKSLEHKVYDYLPRQKQEELANQDVIF